MQIAIYYYVLHKYSVYTYLYAIILSSHIVYIYANTTPLVYIWPRTAVRVIISYPNTYPSIYSLLACITAYTLYSTCIVHGYCDWLDWPNSMQLGIAELSVFYQPQMLALRPHGRNQAQFYGNPAFNYCRWRKSTSSGESHSLHQRTSPCNHPLPSIPCAQLLT